MSLPTVLREQRWLVVTQKVQRSLWSAAGMASKGGQIRRYRQLLTYPLSFLWKQLESASETQWIPIIPTEDSVVILFVCLLAFSSLFFYAGY